MKNQGIVWSLWEIFGYYFNTEIVEDYNHRQETDSKTFHLNLQSKNNRLKQPMKFEIKDLEEGGIWLCKQSNEELIWLGDLYLYKENNKNESYCFQDKGRFNYHGIEKALCGKGNYEEFTPKRIIAIQMK